MDTHQITEQIVSRLNLPEWHEARAKLQVWFELMKTWRKHGDPRDLDLELLCEAAFRCVDLLVADQIINSQSSAETQAQITVYMTLCETRKDYTG